MEAPILVRSRNLQERVWEWGGALAPGMSLRLEVTLLAACLRVQSPKSESVMAVPPIYVDRSTAGGHEVFEDADWELQDLVRLEVQWASFGSTGLPLWLSWSRICLQCRRPGFYPFIGKIPQRREKLPTPVFWPGEFHWLYSPWSHKESDMTERLSLLFHQLC